MGKGHFVAPRSRRFLGVFAKGKPLATHVKADKTYRRIPPKRGGKITSFGTTNCLAWGSGSIPQASVVTSFTTGSPAALAGSRSDYTDSRTPELARQEARVLFGKIAGGEDPSEQRQLNHKAITIKELCELYLDDLNAGLIMGKGGRPKKPTTIAATSVESIATSFRWLGLGG